METLELSQYQFDIFKSAADNGINVLVFLHPKPEDSLQDAITATKNFKELEQLVRHGFLTDVTESRKHDIINADVKFNVFKLTDLAKKMLGCFNPESIN